VDGWKREIASKGKGSVGKVSSTIQQNKRGPLLPNQRLPGTLDPEKDCVCATFPQEQVECLQSVQNPDPQCRHTEQKMVEREIDTKRIIEKLY
jgi:hypothetical protein